MRMCLLYKIAFGMQQTNQQINSILYAQRSESIKLNQRKKKVEKRETFNKQHKQTILSCVIMGCLAERILNEFSFANDRWNKNNKS